MAGPYIVPPINTSGVINLKEPFKSLCAANVPYTVVSIRTLGDIVNDGKDPYGSYYEAFGLDQATFNSDVNSGVCIISLRSPSGEFVHVPNSYLDTAPVATGVPYSSMIVGVRLGALPESLSLEYFNNSVKELAHDLLGVTDAEVKAVKVTETTYIPLDESKTFEAARQNVMSIVVTDSAKLRASEIERQKAIQKIAELELFIRTHNWTPK